MEHRPFGQTGIEVAALGMGCMRFERPNDTDDMAQVVKHAHDRGVTYFDTAPGYCGDKSEIIVGAAVPEMKKSGRPFQIATKTMKTDPKEARADLERSLERLHLDAIDFYHVWCIRQPGDIEQRNSQGLFDELRKARDEGLIRHICVSVHLVYDQVAGMLDYADGLFEGMLIGLNAINHRMRLPAASEAAGRGLGVVTMNTLGGGLLTQHPEVFDNLKGAKDESILQAALCFNLSLPEVTVALVGFRNVADVDSAFEAVDDLEPMNDAEMDAFRQRVDGSLEGLCTQCNYCKDCPQDLPVMKYMEAYNERVLGGGSPQRAKNRLHYHWGISDVIAGLETCTECGACEQACTQHLPILERFDQLREDQRQMAAQQK